MIVLQQKFKDRTICDKSYHLYLDFGLFLIFSSLDSCDKTLTSMSLEKAMEI